MDSSWCGCRGGHSEPGVGLSSHHHVLGDVLYCGTSWEREGTDSLGLVFIHD